MADSRFSWRLNLRFEAGRDVAIKSSDRMPNYPLNGGKSTVKTTAVRLCGRKNNTVIDRYATVFEQSQVLRWACFSPRGIHAQDNTLASLDLNNGQTVNRHNQTASQSRTLWLFLANCAVDCETTCFSKGYNGMRYFPELDSKPSGMSLEKLCPTDGNTDKTEVKQ